MLLNATWKEKWTKKLHTYSPSQGDMDDLHAPWEIKHVFATSHDTNMDVTVGPRCESSQHTMSPALAIIIGPM